MSRRQTMAMRNGLLEVGSSWGRALLTRSRACERTDALQMALDPAGSQQFLERGLELATRLSGAPQSKPQTPRVSSEYFSRMCGAQTGAAVLWLQRNVEKHL